MTADALRESLAKLNWTQKKLSEETGVTLRTAQRWLAGECPVPSYVKIIMNAKGE